MKKYHVRKENYPTILELTKPDVEFGLDGGVQRKSWYFSICDWMGNELFGSYSESKMLAKVEELEEKYDTQIFAYPLIDGEEIHMGGHYNNYREWVAVSAPQKENYVFPLTW